MISKQNKIKVVSLILFTFILLFFSCQVKSQDSLDQLLKDKPQVPDAQPLPSQETLPKLPQSPPSQEPPTLGLPTIPIPSQAAPTPDLPTTPIPSQAAPTPGLPTPIPQATKEQKKKRFVLFKPDPVREKQRQERRDLIEKQKQELEDLRTKATEERKTVKTKEKKAIDLQQESKLKSDAEVLKREKEVKAAKRIKRVVDVTTSESDPLLIKHAEVKNTKTLFLKVKDVDFSYQIILKNQTPKIINFALIVWDRKIPFTGGETLIKKTVTVSKPIVPYEERIVEFNEPDSKREGESFAVRVVKVIFEDKTEWKNPLVHEDE